MLNQSYTIVPKTFTDSNGARLTPQDVLQRIGWLIELVRPVADHYMDAHFTEDDLNLLHTSTLPVKGHVASASLGWSESVNTIKDQYGVYLPDRVLRMSREHCVRTLRSTARRALITKTLLDADSTQDAWDALANEHGLFLTGYEIRNRFNAINNFTREHGLLPTGLTQLEKPPTYPNILLAAATDSQWQTKTYDPATRMVVWQVLLPTVVSPQSMKDYGEVNIVFKHPDYVQEFTKICTPTVRLTSSKAGNPQVTLDVSYTRAAPPPLSDVKRSRAPSIGLDWGTSSLLTGVVAHKSKTGNVIVDSQGLNFKPVGVAKKLKRLKSENNRLLTQILKIQNLVNKNPSSIERKRLEVKIGKLKVKRDAVNRKRRRLNKALAYAAARWVFDLVEATGARTVYVEDLKTMLADKQDKWFAGVVSDTVRGQIFEYLKQLGLKHGVKVLEVNPRNTSKHCHKCASSMVFYTHSDLKTVGHRWAYCKTCNYTCDRDYNASVNIVSKGILDVRKATCVDVNKVSSNRVRKHRTVKAPKNMPTPKQVKPRGKHKSFSSVRVSWSCPHLRHSKRRLRRARCRDITSKTGAWCYGLYPHVTPAKLI